MALNTQNIYVMQRKTVFREWILTPAKIARVDGGSNEQISIRILPFYKICSNQEYFNIDYKLHVYCTCLWTTVLYGLLDRAVVNTVRVPYFWSGVNKTKQLLTDFNCSCSAMQLSKQRTFIFLWKSWQWRKKLRKS